MAAVAHGWRPKGVDVPVKVAREFVNEDQKAKINALRKRK
jgi:hypothetical protein